MPLIRRHAWPLLMAALFALPLLAGCAGMPLQEMSDARQAIRAAERAGAQQYAPELLAEAKTLVESARQSMHKSEYREARDDAEQARAKAMEARRVAETAKGGGSS
jgi:hypothetical protein